MGMAKQTLLALVAASIGTGALAQDNPGAMAGLPLAFVENHGQWQPPVAFAHAIRQSHPEISSKVGEMAGWYYAMRYGDTRDPGAAHRMRQVLDELDEVLGH